MVWNRNQEGDAPAPASPRTTSKSSNRQSTLGPSLKIRGDLTGSENLRIEGSVEGTIELDKHEVLVSESGRVKADVHGRRITVEGRVEGNLFGEEEVMIRPSGTLEGNITAPSVTLENGAKFRGSIDMEPKPKPLKAAATESPASAGAKKPAPAAPPIDPEAAPAKA